MSICNECSGFNPRNLSFLTLNWDNTNPPSDSSQRVSINEGNLYLYQYEIFQCDADLKDGPYSVHSNII